MMHGQQNVKLKFT